MAYGKKSTAIDFPANTPVTIVLKTNPSMAKPKEYTSAAGKKYTKWTYFTADGGVFWAFGDLHKELQRFSSGDSVTLTNVVPMGAKYGTFKVEGQGSAPANTPVTSDATAELAKLSNLIRLLIQRFDAFMSQGQPTPTNNAPKETREKADTSLDF